MPSLASSLPKAVAKPCFSASMPSSRSPLPETCLIWPRATGAWPASLRPQASAVSNSSWSGTTRLTRPNSSASSARIASPTRFISSALFSPTRRGRRWVPPKPGMIPSLISGWPKTAASAPIRTSQAIASSQPPPKAIELTAATVAVLSWPKARSSACAVWISSSPLPSSIWVNALMSAPAEKTTGTEEATTIAPMPSSALTLSQTVFRSRITSGEIAFIGRLRTRAMAPPLLALVGLRVRVEPLARLEPVAPLGDEALQRHRRREALAVLLLELLDPLQHRIEPLQVGFPEGREEAPAGVEAGAGHHPQVDVADRADALLDQQASLDQGAAGEHRDQLLGIRLGVAGNRLLAVLEEPLAAALGAELAFGDELLKALVDVEALAVGLAQVLGDVQHGVEPEQVGEEEGPHRRDLGRRDRLVDLRQGEALVFLGAPDLADRRHQDSVDDEARRLAADDRLLADRLGEVVGGRGGLARGVLAGDDLDQRHHRGGVEEVEADDLVGPQRRFADLGDRERGGVGGEDRVARRGGVELAEDRLLDLHPLRHRLHHEVDVAELLVAGRPGDPAHDLGEAGVGLLLGQLLLLDEAAELALGDGAGFLDGGIDELLVDVLDDDGDVGGGDRLRDLAAHGAAADDGGLRNEHWLGVPLRIGDRRRL